MTYKYRDAYIDALPADFLSDADHIAYEIKPAAEKDFCAVMKN